MTIDGDEVVLDIVTSVNFISSGVSSGSDDDVEMLLLMLESVVS